MIISNFVRATERISLKEVAEITSSKLINDDIGDTFITGVSSLKFSQSGDVSFCNNLDYVDDFSKTKATACFITEKYQEYAPKGVVLLICKDPYIAFAMVLQKFYKLPVVESYISDKAAIDSSTRLGNNVFVAPFSVIGKNVVIGDNTYIGANTIIGDNVKIGSGCYIHGGSSIKYAEIGSGCILHEGVRIGQDGFGFVPNMAGHIKIPQIAKVIVGHQVEIGANTCIDRGAVNNTLIGDGSKIDNLVQIGHGVEVGRGCFLAANVGIAGSTIIEDFVSLGGGAGVAPHITIGSGAQVAPMSGVGEDIKAGSIVMGFPAMNFTSFWRLQALFKRMLKKKS